MKKVVLTAACAAVLLVAGCAGGGTGSSNKDLIAKAEAEVAKAKKANNLWSNTEKALADAKAADKAGDSDTAQKKAKQALDEATLAQKQAETEKSAKANFK